MRRQIMCWGLAAWLAGAGVLSAQRVVIAAGTVLDGKGGTLRNVNLVVEGGKILAIRPRTSGATAGAADYDLRRLTVLPGWIDAHTHITWIFGKDGRNAVIFLGGPCRPRRRQTRDRHGMGGAHVVS